MPTKLQTDSMSQPVVPRLAHGDNPARNQVAMAQYLQQSAEYMRALRADLVKLRDVVDT